MRSPLCLRSIVAVALGLALAAGRAHAVGSEAGAISLTFGPSARGEAMGGLFVTEANDYAARWGNPGALAFIDRSVVGTYFSQLVPGLADDVYYMYGGYVKPTKNLGTLQFDLTYLTYGKSQATDISGNIIGEFSSYELSPSAAIGFRFVRNLGVGLAVKYVRIDLADSRYLSDQPGSGSGTGNSWAFDLGALYRSKWLRLGGAVTNLGPDITFIDAEQSDPLPRTLRFGASGDIAGNDIMSATVGLEVEQSMVNWQRDPVYHLGGEFIYASTFALRAGYLNDNDGAVKGVAAGFGFSWSGLTFEYANVPQAESLDRVNRFALWYKFGAAEGPTLGPQTVQPGPAGD
jgi:hypothetical protein